MTPFARRNLIFFGTAFGGMILLNGVFSGRLGYTHNGTWVQLGLPISIGVGSILVWLDWRRTSTRRSDAGRAGYSRGGKPLLDRIGAVGGVTRSISPAFALLIGSAVIAVAILAARPADQAVVAPGNDSTLPALDWAGRYSGDTGDSDPTPFVHLPSMPPPTMRPLSTPSGACTDAWLSALDEREAESAERMRQYHAAYDDWTGPGLPPLPPTPPSVPLTISQECIDSYYAAER